MNSDERLASMSQSGELGGHLTGSLRLIRIELTAVSGPG